MGKKYIIEIPEDKIADFVGSTHFLMPYMMAGHVGHHDTGLPIEPYTEPDLERVRKEAYEKGYHAGYVKYLNKSYEDGLSDAWEAARKIEFGTGNGGISTNIMEEIFGTPIPNRVLRDFAASEAIEKLKAYEREQDSEIKVGDEVIPRETEYDDMIVTRLWKDDYDSDCIDAIGFDGRIGSFLVSRVSKTGKHYEIAEVLRKMKETE